MTPAVVAAVKIYNEDNKDVPKDGQPGLEAPAVGDPISHTQLIDISKYLKEHPEKARNGEDVEATIHLSELLKGCAIYIPPPPPKLEKVHSQPFRELSINSRLTSY
jgi:hypothetical protein